MTEKESVTDIYKHLKGVHGVNAVEKSTFGCWALQIASSEKGQVAFSNVTHILLNIKRIVQ